MLEQKKKRENFDGGHAAYSWGELCVRLRQQLGFYVGMHPLQHHHCQQ